MKAFHTLALSLLLASTATADEQVIPKLLLSPVDAEPKEKAVLESRITEISQELAQIQQTLMSLPPNSNSEDDVAMLQDLNEKTKVLLSESKTIEGELEQLSNLEQQELESKSKPAPEEAEEAKDKSTEEKQPKEVAPAEPTAADVSSEKPSEETSSS